MIAIRKIIHRITTTVATSGAGTLDMSIPVLREEEGELYISFYAIRKIDDGQPGLTFTHPVLYCICDIVDGGLRQAYLCQKKNFSSEPLDAVYHAKQPDGTWDESFYDTVYSLFDSTRQAYLETGNSEMFRGMYADYFDKAIQSVPDSLKVFCQELSRLPEPEEDDFAGELPFNNPNDDMPFNNDSDDSSANNDDDLPFNHLPQPTSEAPAAQPQTADEEPDIKPVAEKAKPAEEEVPAKEAEDEVPPIPPVYRISDIDWDPAANLSTLPEKNFRILERIAGQITFLDCDKPDQVRYEYPLFCFDSDRHQKSDKWLELVSRLDDLPKGHFRISPRKSIYTTCQRGKEHGCVFSRCPYAVAAYIRYLQDYHPKELERQRRLYRELRFECDKKYSEAPGFSMAIPKTIDQTKLSAGLKKADTGLYVTSVDDSGNVHIAWAEKKDTEGWQLYEYAIPQDTLSVERDDAGVLEDIDHNPIPEQIAYALLADWLDRSGKYKDILSAAQPQKDQGKEQKNQLGSDVSEKGRNTPMQTGTTNKKEPEKTPESMAGQPKPKETVHAPERQTPQAQGAKNDNLNNKKQDGSGNSQSSPGQEKKAQPSPDRKPQDQGNRLSPLEEMTGRNSRICRCLSSPDTREFFGTLIYSGKDLRQSRAIRDMAILLAPKGFRNVMPVPLARATNAGVGSTKAIYAITGIREGLQSESVHEAIITISRFREGCAVIIAGNAQEVEELFHAAPSLRLLYEPCLVREASAEEDALFMQFKEKLPQRLKDKAGNREKTRFLEWMAKYASMAPANPEDLPAYLAWNCMIENEIRFPEPPDARKGVRE